MNRIKNFQIETDSRTGNVLVNKIVWRDDCKYDMYFDLSDKSNPDKTDSLYARRPVTVEITNINNDYYVCIANMQLNNKPVELKDTMYFQK